MSSVGRERILKRKVSAHARTVAPAPTRGTDTDMDSLMPLLLLSACACAAGEPLSLAIKRRSDVFGVYASEYARAYEPVAFVAIPLHSPMPVLRILSSTPLDPRGPRPGKPRKPLSQKPGVYASSMTHSWYAKPRTPDPHTWYNKPQSSNPSPLWYKPQSSEPSPIWYKPQSSEATPVWYNKPQSSEASPVWYNNDSSSVEETPPIILYAKPNDYGGFTYRKEPTKKRNVKKPVKEPIILRVHKYRIVRDR